MKEAEIRPDGVLNNNIRLKLKDNLVKEKDKFLMIPCPACESKNFKPSFNKEGFDFVECLDCQTLFINPRPPLELLKEYYSNSDSFKYWNKEICAATEEARRSRIFTPRAERIAAICKKYPLIPPRVLVDVGAGLGTFCQEAKKLNIFDRVIAVETAPDLVQSCKLKGLEVIESLIEDLQLDNASVITSFELIEHLFSPREFLSVCAKLLPRGGIIVLTTPNIKGFDLSILGALSNNITGPEHLNYFNTASFKRLLTVCGFDVIEALTPGELDVELVRKKVLSKELELSAQPFLRQVLIEEHKRLGEAFQEFLKENLLSSHLWMAARKR